MVNNEIYNLIFVGILKKYINEMLWDLKKKFVGLFVFWSE